MLFCNPTYIYDRRSRLNAIPGESAVKRAPLFLWLYCVAKILTVVYIYR